MRNWLPKLAIHHPVTVLMGFLALMVWGALALERIPLQMMPDGFQPSVIWVHVPYSGASPRETDEFVVRPVEARLSTLSGVEEMSSRATESGARFTLTFFASRDMNEAYAEVADRMERALADLPEEVTRTWIYKYNPDDTPILWAGLTLPPEVTDPAYLMESVVRPRLERIPGVASLDVWGAPTRSIYLDFHRESLAASGLGLGEIVGRLSRDNQQLGAGLLTTQGQRVAVRSLGRYPDLESLRQLPLGDGWRLGDVAKVELRPDDERSINRINGQTAAALAMMKESGANTVEVTDRAAAVLRELEMDPRLQGAQFHALFNQGDLIRESMDNLKGSALTGGLFAVLILFAFLREARMTALIALAIPVSLLITIAVLYFHGDSLNLLSLMGLMLAVGMVVDNAIVVVETIQRRRAEGAAPREAALAGAAEVNLAIVLSTLTTMVVFLPIILMGENATLSFFLQALGYPVIWALGASLVVALVFSPLATLALPGRAPGPSRPELWLAARYQRVIAWTLRHRAEAVALLLVMGALTVALPLRNIGQTDTVEGNLNDFNVRIEVPAQASDAERDSIVRAFEETVEAHREAWGVRVYRASLDEGSDHGRLFIYLGAPSDLSREEVMKEARRALPKNLPGVRFRIGWGGGEGGGGNTVNITLHGEDISTLDALSAEVSRRLETQPSVLSATSSYEVSGVSELRLQVRRAEAEARGLRAADIGQTVGMALRGSPLRPVAWGSREYPIYARFREEDRSDLRALLAFPVAGETPVGAVVEPAWGKGPSRIYRTDGRTALTLAIDLAEGVALDDGLAEIQRALQGMTLPEGYSWTEGDRRQKMEEDASALLLALVLSAAFVFLIMGALFESFLLPFAVLTTVPMAGLGATWGLYLTGTSLDTMASVGLILLVGVVVNNGIVLLDLVTQLRAQGYSRDEALAHAGAIRLRPILMTALTTIFGLLPMAFGDAGLIGIPYAPLGRVVVFGLGTSTFLTLIFVPFLYTLLDDLARHAGLWLRAVLDRSA